EKLTVSGTVHVDSSSANSGTTANSLRFGSTPNLAAIGSKRTAGGNQNGLDFYTFGTNRMCITSSGLVGVGTTTPGALFHVNGGNLEVSTGDIDILGGSGNVGIGTTTPGTVLDVRGSSKDVLNLQSTNTVGTWAYLNNTSTGGHQWNMISTGSGNGEGAGA